MLNTKLILNLKKAQLAKLSFNSRVTFTGQYTFIVKSIGLLILLFFLSSPAPLQAQQTYERHYDTSTQNYTLSYSWKEQHEQHQLRFQLPASTITASSTYRWLSTQQFHKIILQQLHHYQAQHQLYGAHLHYSHEHPHIHIRRSQSVNSTIQKQHQEQLQKEYFRLEQKLLQERYFTFSSGIAPSLSTSLLPNYAALAVSHMPATQAIAAALIHSLGSTSPREYTDLALSFIQSIPYVPYEQQRAHHFSLPAQVLYENQGSEHSKATLFASIIRNLMPHMQMLFIYTEQKAWIGIALHPLEHDLTYTSNQVTYVVFAPSVLTSSVAPSQREQDRLLLSSPSTQYDIIPPIRNER